MNFGQLITSVTEDLFVFGEAENLVNPHRKFFLQAMSDLQQAIPCLRYANTDFFPQCATFFNCGMTVLPQPQGQVLRVYTIGKINPANATTPPGTQVATATVTAPLLQLISGALQTLPTTGTLTSIPSDGVYTISVAQTSKSRSVYPANSPQYIRTEITYTDLNGVVQTIQPAALIHISDAPVSGSFTIDAQAGTDVKYVITPFNIPQLDGNFEVVLTLISGASGVDDDDWCSKVYYEQVEYAHIEKYVRACNNCAPASTILKVANALVACIFGSWRNKRRYNPPTDVGFEALPALPHGFHYPQTSTDAGGRSRGGKFAIKHGRIYIAPWIESSESVIVEWNGIKTNWNDSDLVSDDPKFIEAVRLFVGIQHYTYYEDNAARLAEFKKLLYGEANVIPGVLREMIIACRERNRVRSLAEVGGSAGDSAGGIGITSGTTSTTASYYNVLQSYTASCLSGQVGEAVTATIPAGQFASTLSQADADAKALAQAQSDAQSRLSCVVGGVFLNTDQTFTATCPAASGTTPAAVGSSATVTIPAGTYQSTVSQALADAAALQAASVTAQSQLACTFYNAPQTSTVTCADTTHETATVPAGQFSSTVSQVDADQMALAEAQKEAVAFCSNPPGAFSIGNTAQTVPYNLSITVSCGTFQVQGNIVIAANTFVAQTNLANSAIVQSQLNQQAIASAQARIIQERIIQTNFYAYQCLQRFGR